MLQGAEQEKAAELKAAFLCSQLLHPRKGTASAALCGQDGRGGVCFGRIHWHKRMQLWVMSVVALAGFLSD